MVPFDPRSYNTSHNTFSSLTAPSISVRDGPSCEPLSSSSSSSDLDHQTLVAQCQQQEYHGLLQNAQQHPDLVHLGESTRQVVNVVALSVAGSVGQMRADNFAVASVTQNVVKDTQSLVKDIAARAENTDQSLLIVDKTVQRLAVQARMLADAFNQFSDNFDAMNRKVSKVADTQDQQGEAIGQLEQSVIRLSATASNGFNELTERTQKNHEQVQANTELVQANTDEVKSLKARLDALQQQQVQSTAQVTQEVRNVAAAAAASSLSNNSTRAVAALMLLGPGGRHRHMLDGMVVPFVAPTHRGGVLMVYVPDRIFTYLKYLAPWLKDADLASHRASAELGRLFKRTVSSFSVNNRTGVPSGRLLQLVPGASLTAFKGTLVPFDMLEPLVRDEWRAIQQNMGVLDSALYGLDDPTFQHPSIDRQASPLFDSWEAWLGDVRTNVEFDQLPVAEKRTKKAKQYPKNATPMFLVHNNDPDEIARHTEQVDAWMNMMAFSVLVNKFGSVENAHRELDTKLQDALATVRNDVQSVENGWLELGRRLANLDGRQLPGIGWLRYTDETRLRHILARWEGLPEQEAEAGAAPAAAAAPASRRRRVTRAAAAAASAAAADDAPLIVPSDDDEDDPAPRPVVACKAPRKTSAAAPRSAVASQASHAAAPDDTDSEADEADSESTHRKKKKKAKTQSSSPAKRRAPTTSQRVMRSKRHQPDVVKTPDDDEADAE